jgi:hypothetical protein
MCYCFLVIIRPLRSHYSKVAKKIYFFKFTFGVSKDDFLPSYLFVSFRDFIFRSSISSKENYFLVYDYKYNTFLIMGTRRVYKITLLEVFTLFVKVGTIRTTTSFAAVVLPLKGSSLVFLFRPFDLSLIL